MKATQKKLSFSGWSMNIYEKVDCWGGAFIQITGYKCQMNGEEKKERKKIKSKIKKGKQWFLSAS